MISLIQRVSHAAVTVQEETVGAIGSGLLALIAVQRGDTEAQARRMAERLTAYRVFPDAAGRMNLDVNQAGGGILLVPQFTLAADTRKGNRPSLGRAADPAYGRAAARSPPAASGPTWTWRW
jgi:D-tyrosyl-tRNA(Tyr) deacylase